MDVHLGFLIRTSYNQAMRTIKNHVLKILAEMHRFPFESEEYDKRRADLYRLACHYFKLPDSLTEKIVSHKEEYLKIDLFQKFIDDLVIDIEQRRTIFQNFHHAVTERGERKRKPSKKRYSSIQIIPLASLSSYSIPAHLPALEIHTKQSAYIIHKGIPYLLNKAVLFMGRVDDKDFYSEQKWIEKEPLKLISALNLALDEGRFSFFVSDFGKWIKPSNYDLNFTYLADSSIDQVKNVIDFLNETTILTGGRHIAPSPQDYEFNPSASINHKRLRKLLHKIDTNNGVLMRCLYYYSKACALVGHRMLMEESTALLFFCLDGITKLLMKKHKLGSVAEIDEMLIKKYECPYGEWLNECYDERTLFVHPENRFGDY